MSEHRLEVADVFRKHERNFFERWGAVLAPYQKKAFEATCKCRTAVLGGHAINADTQRSQVPGDGGSQMAGPERD